MPRISRAGRPRAQAPRWLIDPGKAVGWPSEKQSVDGVVKHSCQAPLKHWGVLASVVGGAIHKETAQWAELVTPTSNLGRGRPT